MASALGTTDYLALLFGIYMIAAAAGMLRRPQMVDAIMRGLKDNDLLAFILGIFILAVGGAIVGVHNRWDTPLEFVVSLIGWAALVEGFLMLLAHDLYIGVFAGISWSHRLVRIISVLCILGGVALVAAALA